VKTGEQKHRGEAAQGPLSFLGLQKTELNKEIKETTC